MVRSGRRRRSSGWRRRRKRGDCGDSTGERLRPKRSAPLRRACYNIRPAAVVGRPERPATAHSRKETRSQPRLAVSERPTKLRGPQATTPGVASSAVLWQRLGSTPREEERDHGGGEEGDAEGSVQHRGSEKETERGRGKENTRRMRRAETGKSPNL